VLLITRIFILSLLSFIFIQDLLYRGVYWFLFPVLVAALMFLHFLQPADFPLLWQSLLLNIGFIMVQLLLLTVYLSLKGRKLVNITAGLLGWGDVLFLLAIAFYLSFLNYIFFYTSSLPVVLFLWLLWQFLSKNKNPHIPLAGFQSLLFIVFLASDWWYFHINMTNDSWLLNCLQPWM
jgi:hypothetical protein